jgi:hypothetical protein
MGHGRLVGGAHPAKKAHPVLQERLAPHGAELHLGLVEGVRALLKPFAQLRRVQFEGTEENFGRGRCTVV